MRNRLILSSATTLLAGAMLVGCSSGGSSSESKGSTKKADTAAMPESDIPIPADSPFAKVKAGMSQPEVYDLIGRPTSEEGYATGKAWVPFHYGGDNYRMVARYKKIGVITFSQKSSFGSGMRVIRVDYNPEESGYAPVK